MPRLMLLAGLAVLLPGGGCSRPGDPLVTEEGGKLPFVEDTRDRYVEIREGERGRISSVGTQVDKRPELDRMREICGDLHYICSTIQGRDKARLVVESGNKSFYQVIYRDGDRDALRVIAKPLGLVVTQIEREVQVFTLRVAPGGHRLSATPDGQATKVAEYPFAKDFPWILDGVNLDELAEFLESQYRLPVANLTSLDGRWSIRLSKRTQEPPKRERKVPLDDLGLELQWERVTIPVTVVTDQPKP